MRSFLCLCGGLGLLQLYLLFLLLRLLCLLCLFWGWLFDLGLLFPLFLGILLRLLLAEMLAEEKASCDQE